MVSINIEVAKDGSILPMVDGLSQKKLHRIRQVFDKVFNSCSYVNYLLYSHKANQYVLHKVDRGDDLRALYFFVNMQGKADTYSMTTYSTAYEALVALSQTSPNLKYRKKISRILDRINSEMFNEILLILN